MKKTVFTGSAVALATPFTEQGTDYAKLAELIEFQIANGTDAIVICGTTGESATMPDPEHKEAIRFAVERVAGRVPVIAGTGSNDTAHGVSLCQYAESVGADALLLVTPYYNKCTQEGLVRHYTAMAQSVKIPCILYNVPSRTGVNIAPETLKRLAEIDNIVGIKEASGNISQVAKIAASCDLDLYSGNDDQVIPLLSLGGKGVISVLANVCPQQTHDMVMEYLEGDRQKALSLQLSMLDLIDALFIEVNPIPVKEALNMMGFDCGQLRLPLCEMSAANREVLRTALQNHNLL